MRWLSALTACLASVALAVYSDEAYQIDYHHALLGVPLPSTTFFHQPFAGSKASLLYTFSEEGVLGAVNPKDGGIVWRHKLDAPGTSRRRVLRAGEAQDTVVAAYGTTVSAWSSSDGKSAWRREVNGRIADVEVLEMPLGDSANGKDSVLLFESKNGCVVERLDAKTGELVWGYNDDR